MLLQQLIYIHPKFFLNALKFRSERVVLTFALVQSFVFLKNIDVSIFQRVEHLLKYSYQLLVGGLCIDLLAVGGVGLLPVNSLYFKECIVLIKLSKTFQKAARVCFVLIENKQPS
jgi:hypothetical protein